MFKYMEDSVNNGSIINGFQRECQFSPINQTDVARAVSHCMNNGLAGRFMLQGNKDGNKHYSAKELLGMVERSANKNSLPEGNAWLHSITSLVDDFFIGNTHDGNLGAMLNHYADSGVGKADGELACFWEASGLSAESVSVADFYRHNPVNPDQAQSNWKFHLD